MLGFLQECVKYKVRMIVNLIGKPKIVSAMCDSICPVDMSGCCCHVMAVIWKLDKMSRKNDPEIDVPCTSKPRKRGHEPIIASKLFKPRHNADTPGHKRRGVVSTFYDPRPLKNRKLDLEPVEHFRENTSVPFGKMTPNTSDIVLVNTLIGTAAKGSVLQMQLKDFNITSATSTSENSSVLQPKSCVKNTIMSQDSSTNTVNSIDSAVNLNLNTPICQPLSQDKIRERCSAIKKKLFIGENEIKKLDAETRGQSNNQTGFITDLEE